MINTDTGLHIKECKCFGWQPIIAGALTAVGLSFLLNLFSVAIGLTAYTTNSEGVETLAFSGLIATALGIIVAMFASGWLAGYLGNRHCTKRHLGSLYGFLAWCLALILAILLVEPIQHYINFYTHFISGTTVNLGASTANNAANVSAQVKTTSLVISTYIIFCLFVLGAFASTLGGHAGMRYINRDERIK